MRDSLLLSQTSLFLVFRCKNSEILFLEPIYNGCETQIMKSLSTIFTLTFTVMFSSTSFGEWTEVGQNVDGESFYVDFERIRKVDGYVYYWMLVDYLKPKKFGDLSGKLYKQGDCKLFRKKTLSYSFHKEPMGRGAGRVEEPIKSLQVWQYPQPKSSMETIVKSVCNHIGE